MYTGRSKKGVEDVTHLLINQILIVTVEVDGVWLW